MVYKLDIAFIVGRVFSVTSDVGREVRRHGLYDLAEKP